MAKIGITLDEVLRDFVSQFIYTYNKYIEPTDIKETDVTTLNLLELFKFENEAKLNSFIYMEAPLEIFGHADQVSDGLMNHFNDFLAEMEYEGEHEVELVTREADKAIPSTLFFLSKTGAKPSKIRFVKSYDEVWNGVDVLITATPKILEKKPSDKTSIKVTTLYNTTSKSDYEISKILDFFRDGELRKKLLTPIIITTYEEI